MNEQHTDLYRVLGLGPRATQGEISHAYRSLLRRHHPDTRPGEGLSEDPGADLALQGVIAAYAVLGDPTRRADYDRQVGSDPARPRLRRPSSRLLREAAPDRPPIVAGPVRWRPGAAGPRGSL